MQSRLTAIVPMRHHSERVLGKNYKLFNGRPLYHFIIETLTQCSLISEIVIDTDSPVILRDAKEHFSDVRLLERPAHLRSGEISMNEVLLYDVTQIAADWYVQTHSTNPLLQTKTVSKAIETFLSKIPEHDSLFSVTRVQSRFWDTKGRPINHDPRKLLRTQDLPPIYEENSNIYIFNRHTLESRRNRIGNKPLMFEIDSTESLDIDDHSTFQVAEFLYRQRQGSETAI